MTQIPAGWYPDPAPRDEDQDERVRYWDGRVWTVYVAHAAPEQERRSKLWARLFGTARRQGG